MSWPRELQINAFAGEGVANASAAGPATERWAARAQDDAAPVALAPAALANRADWSDPRVGWGLVLPDAPKLGVRERAAAEDAPEPLRRLLAARSDAPVLRYRKEIAATHLHRDYADGSEEDLAIAGPRGVGRGELPRYLLIYGQPALIPWRFQFRLNQSAAVGRIALTDDALARYIDHLIEGWEAGASDAGAAVVWATDHGPDDITSLMRTLIARPLLQRMDPDPERRAVDLTAPGQATASELTDALAANRPGLVVTTSHGMTGPLDDPVALCEKLGLPVDQSYEPLALGELLRHWQPDGAVWYSHACCSAGSDAQTAFADVVPEGSDVARILAAVAAAAGARIAPLPQALLSADKPARAFVGHVEPTFDWTIRDPMAGQPLTASTVDALYDRLYQPMPIGLALSECFVHVGELFGARNDAYDDYRRNGGTLAVAGLMQLAALDRRSLVIIGDPTVMPAAV